MLNNRELAGVIDLGTAFAVLLLLGRDIRSSFVSVLRSTFRRKLTELWLLYGLSVTLAALLLDRRGLRYPGSVKDVAVWAVIAGLPIFVRFGTVKEHPDLLFQWLLKAVRFTVIVEFFVNLYVFPLWVEIPMQAMILIITLVSAYAKADSSTPQAVRKFLGNLLGLFGCVLLAWAGVHLTIGWKHINWQDTGLALTQPVALTAVAVAVTGLVALLAAYETSWTGMRFPRDGRRPRLHHGAALVVGLHVRVSKVSAFRGVWAERLKAASSFAAAYRVVRLYTRAQS